MSLDRRYVDILTMGRSGVDIFPLQVGEHLEDVKTFGKFLGGSPTNVAVAVARLGHRAGVITGVGDDPFGRFVTRELERLGVSSDHVVTVRDFHTPVTFAELFPPDSFPLYFYREPSAPDLELRATQVDWDAVERAGIFWFTVTGLSRDSSFGLHLRALDHRDRGAGTTILDLDYRSNLWSGMAQARSRVGAVLSRVDVAVGNREECEMAVGVSDPEGAADALLERGVGLAIVKQGPKGTLAKTADERVWVEAQEVTVLNGLGAGDAFGGALIHGLVEGWDLERTIRYASAAGAYVCSHIECSTAMPTQKQLSTFVETGVLP